MPINKVISTEEPWPCIKCSGPYFQSRCTEIKATPMTSSETTRRLTIYTSLSKIVIPMVSSLQVSKQVKPAGDISSTINLIKCFISKIGKMYFAKEDKHPIQYSQVTRGCSEWGHGNHHFSTSQTHRQGKAIAQNSWWRGSVEPLQQVLWFNVTQLGLTGYRWCSYHEWSFSRRY